MWSTLPYCLSESLRGQHHLFDARLVRRSFDEPLALGPEALAETRALLELLRAIEDLGEQRRRISCAPDAVQRLFVRLYFDYLEGYVESVGRVLH